METLDLYNSKTDSVYNNVFTLMEFFPDLSSQVSVSMWGTCQSANPFFGVLNGNVMKHFYVTIAMHARC